MSIGKAIGAALATLAILYLVFDFFFWNGGLVDPSIFTRIENAIGLAAYFW